MNINEHMVFTRSTAIYPFSQTGEIGEVMYLALGLASEAGEVAGLVKKMFRDRATPNVRDLAQLELGDVFWYLNRLCDYFGLDPGLVLEANRDKLNSRLSRGKLSGSGDNR